MDKKLIKRLGEVSYIDNKLDEQRVNRIAEHLNRRELKEYIKSLKGLQSKKRVYVEYSNELSEEYKKAVEVLFPDKEVIFRENRDLLMGLRITEDDIVFNINLKNSLGQITEYFDKYI